MLEELVKFLAHETKDQIDEDLDGIIYAFNTTNLRDHGKYVYKPFARYKHQWFARQEDVDNYRRLVRLS